MKIVLTNAIFSAILLTIARKMNHELKYPFLMSILPSEESDNYLSKFPAIPNYPFFMSILPPEEGGGYLIEFPDLPGCMSDGDTIEETIENGKDAVFCWIESAKEFGDEIPKPGSAMDLVDIGFNKSLSIFIRSFHSGQRKKA